MTSKETKLEAIVRQLTEDNQRLRDEIDYLKESMIPPGWMPPIEFQVTGQEGNILGMLLKHDICSKQMLHTAISLNKYSMDDETDIKIVDVMICKLRKKLEPFEFKIETRWGFGYYMPSEDRKEIQDMTA